MSGLITNPDIVHKAVNGKNGHKSQKKTGKKEKLKDDVQGKKVNVKQENAKTREKVKRVDNKSRDESGEWVKDENGKRVNGRSKSQTIDQSDQSENDIRALSHVRAKSSPVNATEELRRALFPDLYAETTNGKNAPEARNSTPKKPKSQQTTPHKHGHKSTPSPNTSQFAGSSFHSSPAPSSLPKPAFKMKTVDQSNGELTGATPPSDSSMYRGTTPFYMTGAPIPPPTFPHMPVIYNPMMQRPPQVAPSMFDQFMMADRQERAAAQHPK